MIETRTRYVVAVSEKEAKLLAPDFGWDDLGDAIDHLADVKSPPTDPYYASMYQVFEVEV